jgi:small conductance mechanosensitive channel
MIAIPVIVIGYLINRLIIQKYIDKFGKNIDLDVNQVKPLKKLTSYLLWISVLFIVLGIFGLTDFLWGMFAAVGFAGIVIGMATRDIISDMLTGVLLYIYRPIKIGDSVAIGDIWGKVTDIGIAGVKIKAWSGELVIIPNSHIRTSIIRNFSIDARRATITFFVDFTLNFSKTLNVCKSVLDGIPEVMKNPEPVIRIDDFTERSVKILILVWFSIDDFWSGYAKIQKELADEFKKMGLKIPKIKIEEAQKNTR